MILEHARAVHTILIWIPGCTAVVGVVRDLSNRVHRSGDVAWQMVSELSSEGCLHRLTIFVNAYRVTLVLDILDYLRVLRHLTDINRLLGLIASCNCTTDACVLAFESERLIRIYVLVVASTTLLLDLGEEIGLLQNRVVQRAVTHITWARDGVDFDTCSTGAQRPYSIMILYD